MAFYTRKELEELGFKYIGKNVKISNRASIYNHELISIGDNSRIDDFCVLSGKITIGKNVHIAVYCNMAGGEKGIVMEDFSGLAYGVNVFTQSDDYTGLTLTNPTIPDKYKKETKKPIFINKHVIIGAGSMIFPGVTIEEGCSVGAMSMVTKNTKPWKIYSGIPARPINDRKKDMLDLERQYLEELKL
ncbi:galactoside O-acetyltransferase [Dethiosulfatibacter aminovorans DSM 17477]|uniref:Chloramphenicol acetyltransferase n=1 Tax=Dethiosulfatibacter aminovorans DSM 17477 TaxID=1121476 RepID=A0A1M6LMP5_9FIRM|nr:acyltransferase [Dethiosulfatibacter aminovorans]SHJ72382.1 galactoside O-acetyltransferase [Dethiosulfatibacter aminovorans DSM 17477]